MPYKLEFTNPAAKQWRKLPEVIQRQMIAKLEERLLHPRIPGDALSGNLAGLYRLKFKTAGIRLIYEVQDEKLILLVISVGKRDKSRAYREARRYLSG